MAGQSISQILAAEAANEFSSRDATRRAYREAGYTRKPTNQVYGYALNKLKLSLAAMKEGTVRKALEDMSVTHFAEIVACDDLFSVASTVGGALYSAYQNPHVKKFIDHMIAKGRESLSSLFSSGSTSVSSEYNTQMGNASKEGVSLNHIFSTLTESVPAESDPYDIPKSVFTNRATGDFPVAANASGAFFFKLAGRRMAESWSVLNNASAYNPDSGVTTGTFATGNGPLLPSISLISRLKLEGFEIEIIPSTSFNSSQGALVFGFLTSDSYGTDPFGSLNILTFDEASTLPFFRVGDVKQRYTSRMFPTTDTSIPQWTTPTPTEDFYGTFICIGKGLSASVTVQFRWTLLYSIQPVQSALNLIRGKIPKMGPYTDTFMEWLSVKYPDIVYWPAAEVLKLYRKLQDCGSENYSDLIRVEHLYDHKHIASPTYAAMPQSIQEF
jgi:hypothetical protein